MCDRMKLHQKSEVNVVPCKHFQYEFDSASCSINKSTYMYFSVFYTSQTVRNDPRIFVKKYLCYETKTVTT